MDEDSITFPNGPRLELEKTIAELMASAQHVLSAQGRLRSLLNATRAVNEDLDLEGVLRRIVSAAVDLADAQYGALGVIDEEGALEKFIHQGISDGDVERLGPPPEGHGLVGAVIEEGQTIRIAKIADDPRAVGFPEHHPHMDSFLGVPIRTRSQVFGNLYLANATAGTFSEEDQELIEALASTAGIAIENARLFAEARRREQLSAALSNVTAALLNPNGADALAVVAESVASAVQTDLVAVITPGEDELLRIDVAHGPGADQIVGTHYPAAGALAAQAIRQGTLVTGRLADSGNVIARPFGHTAAVPLVAGGRAVGALCVSRVSANYTQTELQTIADFASQAGIAISLARAREQRQRLQLVEDRSRIARDLHDHVIQRLFATALGLQALESALPEQAEAIEQHIDELDAAITDIRTAIFALRNQARPGSGLRQRVVGLVAGYLPLPRLSFEGPIDLVVTGEIADDVVAVVRESLANITRHAQASTSLVALKVSETQVTVSIEDDGVGLPHRITPSGTANLAERATHHGGEYTLKPRPSGGTQARWSVPLPG